ncbi:unnamed protein product [Rhizoctonia solani]|uniref:Uncharacterized protein n=1 Tax=Rhizoctonia solani TaxID=456999 RepID=A0A8H2WI92_9AGAM|nr:unnamed protein product [Rhizoctonia solani]
MSEILADKYSPATNTLVQPLLVEGGFPSRASRTQGKHSPPPNTSPNTSQPETEPQDYPRPPPPPTFAAEHGLPVETQTEHRGAYAVPPNSRGVPSTSPKTSFMHLHK